MLLEKNNLEEEIINYLLNSPTDWARVVESYKNVYGDQKVDEHFAGLLAEVNLRLKLEDLSTRYSERLMLDPIKHEAETDNYLFLNINNKFFIEDKRNNKTHSELDEFAIIDGLPVLFEVKTGYYKDGSRVLEKNNHRKIQYAMRLDRVEYLIRPLEEYFGSKCGYVLLIPQDYIYPYSSLQRELIANNGIISSLGFKRKEFRYNIIPELIRDFNFIQD